MHLAVDAAAIRRVAALPAEALANLRQSRIKPELSALPGRRLNGGPLSIEW